MSSPSRKRARAVVGLTVPSFAQYSMPVPSGKAYSIRPPDITSSIAYSSETRFGYWRLIGVPATWIFARCVTAPSRAAIRLDGRGHAVDHAVVLVDGQAVEPELLGADHRPQVAVVELVAPNRVVERVREVDHRVPVLRVVLRNVEVVVVVEEVELDVVEGGQACPSLLVAMGKPAPVCSRFAHEFAERTYSRLASCQSPDQRARACSACSGTPRCGGLEQSRQELVAQLRLARRARWRRRRSWPPPCARPGR